MYIQGRTQVRRHAQGLCCGSGLAGAPVRSERAAVGRQRGVRTTGELLPTTGGEMFDSVPTNDADAANIDSPTASQWRGVKRAKRVSPERPSGRVPLSAVHRSQR